jgi:hypothetical protein
VHSILTSPHPHILTSKRIFNARIINSKLSHGASLHSHPHIISFPHFPFRSFHSVIKPFPIPCPDQIRIKYGLNTDQIRINKDLVWSRYREERTNHSSLLTSHLPNSLKNVSSFNVRSDEIKFRFIIYIS